MNSQVILYLYLLPRFAPRLSPLSDPLYCVSVSHLSFSVLPFFDRVSAFAHQLYLASNSDTDRGTPSNLLTGSTPEPSEVPSRTEQEEEFPDDFGDLDDEEILAYAEECTQRAALADFEDIPLEDLFSWSDAEGLESTPAQTATTYQDHDDDMDMS